MSNKIMLSINSTVRDTKKNRLSSIDINRDAKRIVDVLRAENFEPTDMKETLGKISASFRILSDIST